MKTKLKPPGIKRLKLEFDGLLSSFAFKFNLRRYAKELTESFSAYNAIRTHLAAGAYTRSR